MSLAIAGLFLSNSSFAQKKAAKAGNKSLVKAASATPSAPAAIPSSKKHSFGIGIGQTFLLGDFESDGKDKITADFFYGYSASHSFDLLVNMHFSKHTKQNEDVNLFGLATSIKSKFYNYDSFAPYVMGGLGFYRPTTTRNVTGRGLVKSDGKFSFGFNLGAGVDLRLNEKYLIGLLSQFHKPFDVEQDDQPDVQGTYLKLMLLVMYTF